MKDIRILFMGTPDFAVATLKSILDKKYNVVGVVTAPDRPAGRGQKIKSSAVKAFASTQNLPVLQPTNLKDETFINELKKLNANLQIVVAFRMLPEVVWSMPKYGTFNLHASLLPAYRGAAPINWAIINGEQKTGVTTFFIDEKIDTGHMIMQEEVIIEDDETAGTLHDKLMHLGANLVLKTIEYIATTDAISTTPQPEGNELKTAYKLNKKNTKIDWDAPIDSIYNRIRGLSPYPTAWSYLHNNGEQIMVKIYDIEKENLEHTLKNGKVVIEDSKIKIAVDNGFIHILKLQLPGKRAMESKSLLNGYTFQKDSKMI